MSGIPITAMGLAQVEALFKQYAEVVLTGDYKQAYDTLYKAGIHFLVFPLRPGECDGYTLAAGDQRMVVRVSELGEEFQPASGDYVLHGTNVRYYVTSGVMDPARVAWTLYCRRKWV
jgi:hypothetical protein